MRALAKFASIPFLADDEDLRFDIVQDLERVLAQGEAEREAINEFFVGKGSLLRCAPLRGWADTSFARAVESDIFSEVGARIYVICRITLVRDLDFLLLANFLERAQL